MTAADKPFLDWLQRFRGGDEDAAGELFARFAQRLLRLAQHQLDPRIRPKVDAEDVVQSAYKSFFRRYGGGNLTAESWDGLWGLLTVITLRKCVDRAEYYHAERRDAAREVGGDAVGRHPELLQQAIDREPSPLEASILAETVEHLIRSLDETERPIIELSLQGYTAGEISTELGRAERTVRRVRARVKRRLQRQR